jgi:peptidylprolyl isomerase/peptidyl-prolyl cis-trans isomerase B (cyclophilin B)
VAKSRVAPRPARPSDIEPELPAIWERQPWRPALVVLCLLAVLAAIGIGLEAAVAPHPAAALAKCKTATQLGPHRYARPPAMCIDKSKQYFAQIHTTKGTIGVQLLASDAPVTVNNFTVLAVNGYYNGMRFFKAEDWVVQTGDPNDDGTGGPGYTLPDEPLPSGQTFDVNSLGMARVPGGPINGGQFFIMRQIWPGAGPGDVYNRFGTVIDGQDVVTSLTTSDHVTSIDVRPQPAGSPSPSPSPSP